jgi:hypothetical protein
MIPITRPRPFKHFSDRADKKLANIWQAHFPLITQRRVKTTAQERDELSHLTSQKLGPCFPGAPTLAAPTRKEKIDNAGCTTQSLTPNGCDPKVLPTRSSTFDTKGPKCKKASKQVATLARYVSLCLILVVIHQESKKPATRCALLAPFLSLSLMHPHGSSLIRNRREVYKDMHSYTNAI